MTIFKTALDIICKFKILRNRTAFPMLHLEALPVRSRKTCHIFRYLALQCDKEGKHTSRKRRYLGRKCEIGRHLYTAIQEQNDSRWNLSYGLGILSQPFMYAIAALPWYWFCCRRSYCSINSILAFELCWRACIQRVGVNEKCLLNKVSEN